MTIIVNFWRLFSTIILCAMGLLGAIPFTTQAHATNAAHEHSRVSASSQAGAYDGHVFLTAPAESQNVLLLDESFDEVTPPALPNGWENIGWVTTAFFSDTLPNAAHSFEADSVTDTSLFSPAFESVASGQLRFHHRFIMEDAGQGSVFAFDGVVLEIAFSHSGPYSDIQAKGATFETGGYDHVIPLFGKAADNPLSGREVWGGASQGYQDVVVNFPPSLAGCVVFLRWRMGTDNSVSGVGYFIDDIQFGGARRTGLCRGLRNASECLSVIQVRSRSA